MDSTRFNALKKEVGSRCKHQADLIARGGFVKARGGFLTELVWLADEIDALCEAGGAVSDGPRYDAFCERVRELYANHTEIIDNDKHLTVAGLVLTEAKFLVQEFDRLAGKAQPAVA